MEGRVEQLVKLAWTSPHSVRSQAAWHLTFGERCTMLIAIMRIYLTLHV